MPLKVAILGATGAVGEMMRQVLAERSFPLASLKLFASGKSVGRRLEYLGQPIRVEAPSPEVFRGVDIVLASTPASVSREWSPIAAGCGAWVIDNSSAWRMDPRVPLVVPEVNAERLAELPKGIVANPNCSTIQMVVALSPLHRRARIRRVVVVTYQASSGKGTTGLTALDAEVAALGQGKPLPEAKAHVARLVGNVLTHDWKLAEEGSSEEEWKIIRETRKILGDDSIQVSPTTARVPVRTGHCEAVHVEFHEPLPPEEARSILASSPGIVVLDDYAAGRIPTPQLAEGRDEVFVGRIRRDPGVTNGLALWIVADNLRKGAATNAVQIAELLAKRRGAGGIDLGRNSPACLKPPSQNE